MQMSVGGPPASLDEPSASMNGPTASMNGPAASMNAPTEASEAQDTNEAHSAPPETPTHQHGSGKKRKQSQVAVVLDDYLDHKKKQSEKAVEMMLEKKKQTEDYCIERCLNTVNAMEELTNEENAIAAEVFKNELRREMFMKQKDLNVRLIWLQRRIRYAHQY